MASWFETHGVAILLAMTVSELILSGMKPAHRVVACNVDLNSATQGQCRVPNFATEQNCPARGSCRDRPLQWNFGAAGDL